MRAAVTSQSTGVTSTGLQHGLAFFAVTLVGSCLALAASSPSIALRASLQLALPVQCVIGKTCLIQKLVDHDPTTARRDYRCGTLTTDGHDGTDIRLRTMADMQAGFAVVAAAAGTVLRTRDGEPDISSRKRGDPQGRDAGNGIVIDHGNGWETQYSHLQHGSIAVAPGQQIVAGQKLGLIGMSGNSEFPHLHFSVRHKGKTIDPFTGELQGSACNDTVSRSGIWTALAARELEYTPTAVISVGLASAVPPKSVADRTDVPGLTGRQAPVILWADVIGAKPGDIQTFEITGPDGRPIHRQQGTIADGGLSWFAFSGKRPPPAGWLSGKYSATYILQRGQQFVAKKETSETIN